IILFFLAWLLSFCLAPIVRSIQQSTPLGRATATAVVYVVLLVVLVTTIVLVVPVLVQQVSSLASQLPELTLQLPGTIKMIERAFTSRGIPIDLSAPSSTT